MGWRVAVDVRVGEGRAKAARIWPGTAVHGGVYDGHALLRGAVPRVAIVVEGVVRAVLRVVGHLFVHQGVVKVVERAAWGRAPID